MAHAIEPYHRTVMRRRLFLFSTLIGGTVGCFVFLLSTTVGPDIHLKTDDEFFRERLAAPPHDPNWLLLNFRDPERKIVQVRMRTGEFGGFFGGSAEPRFQEYCTTDAEMCRRVQQGFNDSYRDAPQPQGDGGSGCEPYGELQIVTSRGEVFIVGLYHRFALESWYEGLRNGFTSYPLAMVAAELYQKTCGTKLGEERFKKLSGDFWIEWCHKEYGEYDLPQPEGPSHGCN